MLSVCNQVSVCFLLVCLGSRACTDNPDPTVRCLSRYYLFGWLNSDIKWREGQQYTELAEIPAWPRTLACFSFLVRCSTILLFSWTQRHRCEASAYRPTLPGHGWIKRHLSLCLCLEMADIAHQHQGKHPRKKEKTFSVREVIYSFFVL